MSFVILGTEVNGLTEKTKTCKIERSQTTSAKGGGPLCEEYSDRKDNSMKLRTKLVIVFMAVMILSIIFFIGVMGEFFSGEEGEIQKLFYAGLFFLVGGHLFFIITACFFFLGYIP